MSSNREGGQHLKPWGSVPLWRKVFYGLGAVILGAALAGLTGGTALLLLSAVSETAATAVSGVIALVVFVAAVIRVYGWMREDYEYIHSTEYAERNPQYVRHRT